MSDEQPTTRRRRRRRATSAQGAPAPREAATRSGAPLPGPEAAPGAAPSEPAPAAAQRPDRTAERVPRRQRTGRDPLERGLRDLVGAGRSQLGVDGALRGRDVNRPADDDLAEAERDLVIVRRHWKPNERS